MISVVIPLYNKAKYIKRALDSVLAQTYQDFEVIVINDGSTDGSEKVVEQYTDPRIRLIHREHINSWGGHAARNLGIAEARADLIAFLDADDEWLPDHLTTIMRLREKFPECGAYATARAIKNPESIVRSLKFPGILSAPSWMGIISNYFDSIKGIHPIHSSTVAIPARVFTSCGVFPVGCRHHGDWDMWCRIAAHYPVAFSNRICCIRYANLENSISKQIEPDFVPDTLLSTLDNIIKEKQLSGAVDVDCIIKYKDYLCLTAASRLILSNHSAAGRSLLGKMTRHTKFRLQQTKWRLLSYFPSPLLAEVYRFWQYIRRIFVS